jgi:hypothetical protein
MNCIDIKYLGGLSGFPGRDSGHLLDDTGRGHLLTQGRVSTALIPQALHDLMLHGIDHRLLFPDMYGAARHANSILAADSLFSEALCTKNIANCWPLLKLETRLFLQSGVRTRVGRAPAGGGFIMAKKIEILDEAQKKESEYHERGGVGDERAERRHDGGTSETRVNQAKSEVGTSESRAHESSDRHSGNNDNLGSGRARSHRNAPGGPKTRARKEDRVQSS